MAHSKSAIKRARQSEKRRLRNRIVKTTLKTAIKKVLSHLEEKNSEEAKAALQVAISKISKAAAKGVIHKRNAARKISRLTKKVNTLLQPTSS
ncbi:MAG: 30S ribosomal protein S20 [Syntrophales bacterium]|nr:30S ribosomal protein S20 [Syntrophales bacterium]